MLYDFVLNKELLNTVLTLYQLFVKTKIVLEKNVLPKMFFKKKMWEEYQKLRLVKKM